MGHAIPDAPLRLAALQDGSLSVEEYERSTPFLSARPSVVVEATVTKEKRLQLDRVADYKVGGKPVADERARGLLGQYFGQASATATEITWCADVFDLLNLYAD